MTRFRGADGLIRLAAALGMVSVAGWARRYPDRRRRRRELAETLPIILERLAQDGIDSGGDWRQKQTVRTVSDINVVLAGPATGPATAVVKVSRTEAAAQTLLHQDIVIARLAADARLDGWSRLLPVSLGSDEIGANRYRVEAPLAGHDGRAVLRERNTARVTVPTALAAITELHKRTGEPVALGGAEIVHLVDRDFDTVRELLVTGRVQGTTQARLDRSWDEVRGGLCGKRAWLSVIHGDYSPGNVLFGAGGAVTGIIDWEQCHERDLALVDVLNYLMTVRMIMRRQDWGSVVCDVLAGGWDEYELEVIARYAAGGDLPTREMTLLAWLRHAAGVSRKSPMARSSKVWVRANVVAVLRSQA